MPVENKNVSLLREQYKGAREFLEGTMADVTSEQANWSPPGRANPIGATYGHVLTGADGLVNAALKGGAPLFASSWAGKTGLSEPPPGPNRDGSGVPDWGEWARTVQVDIDTTRQYAQAVYTTVDEYLGSINDEELGRTVDMSALGLGEMTVMQVLLAGVLSNTQWHTGEISCLKGLQGQKGYPV